MSSYSMGLCFPSEDHCPFAAKPKCCIKLIMKKHLPSRAWLARLCGLYGAPLLMAALSGSSPVYAAPTLTRNPSNTPIVAMADRTLTGRVTDEKNEALPGVSVIIKGSQRGTVTDADGRYRLSTLR